MYTYYVAYIPHWYLIESIYLTFSCWFFLYWKKKSCTKHQLAPITALHWICEHCSDTLVRNHFWHILTVYQIFIYLCSYISDVNIAGPHYIEKGHPIRLTCNASGQSRSPKYISWYIGGLHLYNGINRNVRIITYPRSDVNTLYSELRIAKSDIDNAGTYVCQTSFFNDVLKVAKHKLLVING